MNDIWFPNITESAKENILFYFKNQRGSKSHLINTKQRKVNFSFPCCFVISVRRGNAFFNGIEFASSRRARESTLSALHAFVNSGLQRAAAI